MPEIISDKRSAKLRFCFCNAAIMKNVRDIRNVNPEVRLETSDVNFIEFTISKIQRNVMIMEVAVLK